MCAYFSMIQLFSAAKVVIEDDKNVQQDLELKNADNSTSYVPNEVGDRETQNEEHIVSNESVNSDLADKNTESFKLIVAKTLDTESNRNYEENVETAETKKDTSDSSDSKEDESSNLPESEISLYAPESFDDNSSDQKAETHKDGDEKTSKFEENQEEDLNNKDVKEIPSDETLNNSDLVSDEEFYDVAEEKVSTGNKFISLVSSKKVGCRIRTINYTLSEQKVIEFYCLRFKTYF